ncbi:hypothetical protein L6E12_04190 [Actinokineospora sp. PR83]|uniref:hypothetical protein n=1 Tax=Actinokineospora sp. PR83 TaxID=2884908 RepID=UPI001F1A7F99|nr:hypothetical protein [Actinokineospora sp. PR83]MCG8914989.1 hypothetical protein [Actinokineospora sp. PR83]
MRNSTTPDDDRLHTEDLVSDSSPAKSTVDEKADGAHAADHPADGHRGDDRNPDRHGAAARPDHAVGDDRGQGGFTTVDGTDPHPTDRQSGQSGQSVWDGAPAHDAGPSVDQIRPHGYAEAAATEQVPAQGGQRERGTPAAGDAEEPGAELFATAEVERFRGEWSKVQANFVDDPRAAVRDADHLVAEVMQNLAKTFAEHKRDLEGQWQGGDDSEAHTEDLRQALRRYRSFFNQLLHT